MFCGLKYLIQGLTFIFALKSTYFQEIKHITIKISTSKIAWYFYFCSLKQYGTVFAYS